MLAISITFINGLKKKKTVREEARQVEELKEIAKTEEPLRFEIR